MNLKISDNYSRLKLSLFILPALLLFAIVLFLYSKDALSIEGYIQIQKDSFFSVNHFLGQYPNLLSNLTQLGDALIFLSLLSFFILYAPKIWEALILGSIVSFLLSSLLKRLFGVPRPAAVFDNDSFIIVGKTLTGHNCLPSGHSITIFTTLTILLFAFMPHKLKYKILSVFLVVATGLLLASTRVGVGAHYPLDVITGSVIGYVSGLAGIFIIRKDKILDWFGNIKFFPIHILLLITAFTLIITKIIHEDLIIYYLALLILGFSLYKIVNIYVKR